MKTGFLSCSNYLLTLGLLCFPFGRLLKKHDFIYTSFPFTSLPCERYGKVYEQIGIRKWQKAVPDVSRMFPSVAPRKAIDARMSTAEIEDMIQETCVAELTHLLLCAAGIPLFWIWPGAGGCIMFALDIVFGNLPFILIQRYNRPRLLRYMRLTEARERRNQNASINSQQQQRRGA